MESVYAMVAIGEGVVILILLLVVLSQRMTIVEYREDYLDRQYGFSRRYIKTGVE